MDDPGKIALRMYDPGERKEETFIVEARDIAKRRRELESEGYEFQECGRAHLYQGKEK